MLWPLCSPQNRCRLFVGVLVSFVVCLGSDSAHAQDTTATAQPFVALSPMAQAALYQPTSTGYQHTPKRCNPLDPYVKGHYECIQHGIFHLLIGTGLTTASIWLFTVDIEDEALRDLRTLFTMPFLVMGVGFLMLGVIEIVRGSKLPPGRPPGPRPRPF